MSEGPALPGDVLERIAVDYAADRRSEIADELSTLSEVTPEPVRVARCVLFVAAGDLGRFEQMIELARTDYRDAIVAAEYDRELRRLRDFGWPFGEAEFEPPSS